MKHKLVLSGFALLMLVYTAWRSYDYMAGSLAGVDQATRFLVSAAFLAFSELGLLLWLHVGRPGASTDTQEAAASALIWIDFAGVLVLGLGDMLRHNELYQVDLAALDPVLFLSPWLLVAANLGGYLIYTTADAQDQLARAERQLRHAEIGLEMEARRGAIRELQANREAIGAELAPHYYQDIRGRITGRTLARFVRLAEKDVPAAAGNPSRPVRETLPLPENPELAKSKNGHGQGVS